MKKLLTLFALIVLTTINAQAPQGFNYQATVRNSAGALIINQNVTFKFNIMLNSQTSVPIYSETHFAPTDDLGQVNLTVGEGTPTTGTFSSINWANGSYYLGIELNTGTGYVAMGTTQLLSVPYSLFSGNGIIGVSVTGDSLFLGNGTSLIIPGISEANNAGGQTGITLHTCGATNIHNPTKTYGSMTDQQGNVYKTIVIGSQEWMAENLKTSIYRNGEPIATNLTNAEWENTINTQIGLGFL
jgi:hypothetical protein